MSRGDWWTVAVAFVVAGISYFVGGAWVSAAAVVIGICIGLGLHFRRESCVGGPEIYLRWAVPKNVAGLGITQRQFMAENRSSVAAYRVKMDDVCVDTSKAITARFVEVDIPGHSTIQIETAVTGEIGDGNPGQFDMIYLAVAHVMPKYEWKDDKGNSGVKIPLTLTYWDYAGHKYSSIFEFVDDTSGLGLDTRVNFVKCERLN